MDTPRVYSYRRFSSGRQAGGHSLERQIESARRWCNERKLELDESLALADLGVSAYTSSNATRGALSAFLSAVETGKVPQGSVLLVESLDRLTRAAIPEAVGLLTSIVRAGVRVVSLIDNQEWNNNTINDTTSFLLSVLLFSRAHEESATKSKRVSAAFQRKRNAGLAVVSIMHGPGWVLPRKDGKGWQLDREKAAVVKRVFTLAAKGLGGIAIARKANEEGWPLPWRKRKNTSSGWEHTAISRLLRDRRVLGEWQPRRVINGVLTPDGDPVPCYYPPAIPEDLWHRVQTALSGRRGPQRMQGIKADIFSGLLYCSCGKRLERKAPSSRGSARYYCQNRKAGVTQCAPVSEKVLIGPVLAGIAQIEQDAFIPTGAAEEARERIAIAEAKIAETDIRAERILAALEEGGARSLLLPHLTRIESEKATAEATVAEARNTLATIPYQDHTFGYEMAANAAKAVADRDAVEARHKLARSLSSVVERIVWHGSFAMVTTRGGIGIGINPYKIMRINKRNG